jgi:hypothetical protein
MIEYPVNLQALVPIVLRDTSANPYNGATYNQVNVTVVKADGTVVDVTTSTGNWAQITGTAYAAQGYYNFIMPNTAMNVTGVLQYCIYVSGAAPYFGVMQVSNGNSSMLWDRLGVPISATIALDIQSISGFGGGGGFTTQDRFWLSGTYVTSSRLPTDPASNTWVSFAVSQSFNTSDRSNLNAVKAKTDNLPSDPASQATTNTNISAVTTNVNSNTNTRITEIKGTGWVAADNLHNIFTYTSSTYASGVLSSTLASAMIYLQGAGYTAGQDDLRNISLAIAGISGGGGGGFGPTDRAMLSATWATASLLPADPASNSYLSGVIKEARSHIMGSGSTYGQTNGSGSTVWSMYNLATVNSWNTYIQRIPVSPATTTDVTNARDYLAGTGYVQANNSLVAISNLFTTGAFSAQDHAWLSATYVSMSMVYATESLIRGDTSAIKTKTDLLPNDVVGQTWVYPYLAQIISASAVSGGFSVDDRNNIIYLSQTLGKPQGATVSADIFGIIQTQGTQGTSISQIYTKTNALPVDPVSTAYLTLVSQSLANQIIGGNSNVSGAVNHTYLRLSASIATSSSLILANIQATGSNTNQILTTLGTPAYGSVSADNAYTAGQASNAAIYAQAANSNAQNAANSAGTAATNALVASVRSQTIINTIGTTTSGTVSADIAGVATAVANINVSISGTSTDLTSTNSRLDSLLKKVGSPIVSVSEDLRQIGKISLDIQRKVS